MNAARHPRCFDERNEVLKLDPKTIQALLSDGRVELSKERKDEILKENIQFFNSVWQALLFRKTRVYEGTTWGAHVKRLQMLKRVCSDFNTVDDDMLMERARKYSAVLETLSMGGHISPETAQELCLVYEIMVSYADGAEKTGF
jgi:hypothetical protein